MSLIDSEYFDPIYKSWALELSGELRERGTHVPLRHSLDIVAAFFGYSSYNHLIADFQNGEATLPKDFSPDYGRAEKMAGKRKIPVELTTDLLTRLHSDEQNDRKALAKRLVRCVERNCEYVFGEYCHPAVITIQDAQHCQEIVASPMFVDFLYSRYPFTARQSFSVIKSDEAWGGNFIVNADAALNIAAYLHPESLKILSIMHDRG